MTHLLGNWSGNGQGHLSTSCSDYRLTQRSWHEI